MSICGLYAAEPCDATDPAPGVRIIRAGQLLNRITPREALQLAGQLTASAYPQTSSQPAKETPMPQLKDQAAAASEAEAKQQKFLEARCAEVDAMRSCFEVLATLDSDAKRRVMRWLDDAVYQPRDYTDEPPF